MNVIIPLGGMGERFFNEGYNKPKPLIQILGKTMIQHVIDNLKLSKHDTLVIIYNKWLNKYGFEDVISRNYTNVILINLSIQTEGAVQTILYGLEYIKKTNQKLLNNKTVIIDGDTVYNVDILSYLRNQECSSVVCFEDAIVEPIYSYIKIDENLNILDIKEKSKISNYANTGCYFFEDSNVLIEYCDNIIKENVREKNEFYTSCVIKKMLNEQLPFKAIIIHVCDFDCIGTPNQLKQYSIKNEKNVTHEKKRFCFDLDNTLVTFPKIKNDYTTVKPITKNIEILRKLKSIGHTIIIYTARRMRTFDGNVGKIIKDVGIITLKTLDQFSIPYDEIYFGKPYADFYIDDLAINSYDAIDKSIGFYNNVVKERSHNRIEIIENEYIRKTTTIQNSLLGEIYYYKHIPTRLIEFFPNFIHTNGNDEYIIEKINGTPLSMYFINEILNETLFLKLLNTIKYIHSSVYDVDMQNNIDIYSNYSKKIKKRYASFDYSIFNNYKEVYKNIIDFCDTYELNQNGIIGVIHGDSVFSNIILTHNENFKFIDMKGKCGDTETIFGDIFYDYAKIYQSLIGYDEILLNEIVSNKYRTCLLKCFNNFIINEYSMQCLHNIKMITNSLLFSLIPLHNNEKIHDYYNLIKI